MIRFFLFVLPLVGYFTTARAQIGALTGASDEGQDLFDNLVGQTDSIPLDTLDFQPQFNAEGCLGLDESELADCRINALLELVYTHVNYPQEARKNGIQGIAIISFIVEVDGSLSGFLIEQDPGGGLGEEALRVARLLGRNGPGSFIPGVLNDRPVRVSLNLPVNFQFN
ncbi:MAG: energy transducer TonB [Bacteroidota bacterium]